MTDQEQEYQRREHVRTLYLCRECGEIGPDPLVSRMCLQCRAIEDGHVTTALEPTR